MRRRGRRLALAALLPCLLLAAVSLPSCRSGGGGVTLYVYNWGEYLSDGSEGSRDVNREFEKWYAENFHQNVTVNYSTYASNESMYAKLASGAARYDVVVPSDYMIQRMIGEGMLRRLDFRNIPSIGNIDGRFFGPDALYDYYDPDNLYAVPYLYGMVGIIYNTTMVAEDDPDLGSWNLMWSERHRGNILQFNNPRDAFGSAQYLLGLDVNSPKEADWRLALDKLREQKDLLQGYVMDEIYNKMENGSAAVSAYYAGDYLTMYEENPDLEFYYPREGTNLYVDAMCVPTGSRHPEIAERYIEFMLQEEQAVANAEYTYYASPNIAARESEEYRAYMAEIKDDAFEKMYDTENVPSTCYTNLDGEGLLRINTLWEELKSDVKVGTALYVVCAVILLSLTSASLFLAVRRRRRDRY